MYSILLKSILKFALFFRWKGENVATNEVESVITGIIGVREIVVYGVEVSKELPNKKNPSSRSFFIFNLLFQLPNI